MMLAENQRIQVGIFLCIDSSDDTVQDTVLFIVVAPITAACETDTWITRPCAVVISFRCRGEAVHL